MIRVHCLKSEIYKNLDISNLDKIQPIQFFILSNKVYTVGPDYAHAEARKSPALDGRVERDAKGKEIRYPVILTHKEKLIARTVCLAFKQNVCGFDLLRANGK